MSADKIARIEYAFVYKQSHVRLLLYDGSFNFDTMHFVIEKMLGFTGYYDITARDNTSTQYAHVYVTVDKFPSPEFPEMLALLMEDFRPAGCILEVIEDANFSLLKQR